MHEESPAYLSYKVARVELESLFEKPAHPSHWKELDAWCDRNEHRFGDATYPGVHNFDMHWAPHAHSIRRELMDWVRGHFERLAKRGGRDEETETIAIDLLASWNRRGIEPQEALKIVNALPAAARRALEAALAAAGAATASLAWESHAGPERTGATSMAYSPDGNVLASTGADGRVILCCSRNGQVQREVDLELQHLMGCVFTPDGGAVVLGAARSRLETIGVYTDARSSVTFTEEETGYTGFKAYHPATGRLACNKTCDARVIDVASRRVLWSEHDAGASEGPYAFSEDGVLLACAGTSGVVRLRDAATGAVRHSLAGGDGIGAAAFSADGFDASVSSGTVKVWSVATGELAATFVGHEASGPLSFIPGRALLASGASGRGVLLHDVKNPASPPRQLICLAYISALAASPNGSWLAASCSDGFVRVWELV